MFVTKMFGILALAVLVISASTTQSRQEDSNPEPRMMTWEQHRADLMVNGWTVIQLRNNVDETSELFREAKWNAYKKGFWNHNITDKKFNEEKDAGYWMGLEKIHQMTKEGKWQLLTSYEFDRQKPLTSQGGVAVAIYDNFKVEDELQFYRVSLGTVKSVTGRYTASSNSNLLFSNGAMFSTRDLDADTENSCSTEREGGWWFRNCAKFCPNCKSDRVFYSQETKKWMPVLKTVVAIRPMPYTYDA